MGIKLNLYSNGQLVMSQRGKETMDKINWGPGHIERDGLGIPTIKKCEKKEVEDAHLSK